MWRRLEGDALAAFIDSLEIGVFVAALEGAANGKDGVLRIVAANAKMLRIAGVAETALLDRRVRDAIPGPTAAAIEDRLHLALAFKRPMEFVERAGFQDGAYWWQFSAAPYACADGRKLVCCGVVDISPPQRAADHLQIVAERFWLALQAAQDGIWDWNLVEDSLWLSPQWKAQTGYDDHEVEDAVAAWDGLLCEEDGSPSPTGMRDKIKPFLRASGSEFQLVTHLRHRNGGVIVAHLRATKVIDETGRVVRLVGAQTDITKRALAERQLAASEARFRAIAANVPGVIFQWRDSGDGQDRGFNYVSPRCIQLYGLDPGDLEEDWRHLPVHPEDETRWRAALDDAAQRRRPWSFEGRFLLEDGRTPWWRCIARPMESDQGPVYIGLFVDIDQQKQAELALLASQQRFRDFAGASSDWMWETDGQDRLIWVSDEFHAHTGVDADSVLGASDWAFAGTGSALNPEALPVYRQILADRCAFTGFEYRTRRGDGDDLWVRASGKPRIDAQGRFLGYRGVAKNVTAEKQNEQELRLAAMVFDTTQDAILITDGFNRIVKVNPSFSRITGYAPEEVIGKNPKVLASGRQTEGYYRVMWDSLSTEGRWQGELWNRKKDGSFYLQWASIAVERDEHGQIKHYIAAFQDITQRRANEERLLYHANFDTLTGLPNRRLFNDRLEQALIRARRASTRVAVLFLDLDGFKYVNDTLGHAVGDRLLIEVAGRLRKCIRESDTVARFGGDEFTVFLSDVPDAREVALTGYRILEAMAEPMTLEGQEVICTTSIGASIFPDDAADAEALCRQADAAMYDAKARGKNDMAFFTEELNTKAMSRLQMENNLRRAIERSEFILHFQPKILMSDGKLKGVEALVRWAHPERGMVSPGEFIPIAEESDVIHQLGEWVLRHTCWSAREWVDTGNPPIRFAFNVSPMQFARGNFVSLLQRVMRETEIEPGWLEVEITEGTLMRDPAAAEESLNQIREMGVHVSIDDFGTGYSSLSYLTSLPLDSLKIDQSFVRKITESEKAAAIASSIVGIARSLKLTAVAEGVETAEQLAFLKAAGCDQAQGYLFSRPISFVGLVNWAHARENGRGAAD